MGLLKSLAYMAITGILSFPVGRLLAKLEYNINQGFLAPLPVEKNGAIYNRLKIRKWQNKVPDMSRLLSRFMPRKSFDECCTTSQVKVLIQETCVAEITHWGLCVSGIAILFIWRGIGGTVLYLLYVVLGNLPFIIIQRYNRPRLCNMLKILEKRENRVDTRKQYRKDTSGSCMSMLSVESE